ncbi:bacteriohopanetetrol glucosamine biosynthesis glycosyltransferase HpnI [Stenomitos frigidus]|uniref:Glycosyl transferase n=1 Tax=Stenomitos frigidus ULC18 TaxID=2107698 RepID=A0A2T1E9M0_9CYAN|nr:bacteriohopanetetrol glucosamine biosynthesis glycosyltransferase HpnI [Stenomitos frigidus]PSB29446.1 glycosyl transferase [Stenomitos frigidus ULC18]
MAYLHSLSIFSTVLSTIRLEITFYLLVPLFFLCLTAIGYYGYALYAAHTFFSQKRLVEPSFDPAVSILKPVCGLEPHAYDNLASFCRQNYPTYQVIFSVQDWRDSSVAVIRQLIRDFPDRELQLVIDDRTLGANRKTSNLANAFAKAKYDIVLLADSDVHVEADYLRQVVQPLSDGNVGVVTCLYRSLTEGWLTKLEALSSATEFLPGVLVSDRLEGTKFAMGQTIVIRRSALEVIGGFEAIANYLADDFQLGHLPAQAGYKIVLSQHIIEHVMASSTVMGALQRQLRWMVGIRVSRPWGYVGLIFTYGTVSSLLFLLATGGSLLGWVVLGLTWVSRLAMAWFVGVQCLQDPVAKQLLWLVPLRDCMSFALWCYGFTGNTIVWRGRQFRLTRGGELVLRSSGLSASAKSVISRT